MKLQASSKDFADTAAALASRYGWSLADRTVDELFLQLGPNGLALHRSGEPPVSIRVDFSGGKLGHRQRFGGDRRGLLGRAIGADRRRGIRIVDATAGLAADGFIMASLGCRVDLVEQNAVLVALIEDGLERARAESDEAVREPLQRLRLHHADAVDWLAAATDEYDVIYLDPMFPERKHKAGVRKEMQLLQHLLGEEHGNRDRNEAGLLEAALEAARHRVVVKRPRLAPPLADRPPGYSLKGRAARFDIYPLRAF